MRFFSLLLKYFGGLKEEYMFGSNSVLEISIRNFLRFFFIEVGKEKENRLEKVLPSFLPSFNSPPLDVENNFIFEFIFSIVLYLEILVF